MFVYSTALTVRFRGITQREGLIYQGPAGWAEFSPFTEYDDHESAAWLRAAHEAAHTGFPPPRRTHIPVNVTIPATDPATAHALASAPHGCTTAKVKVAEHGQTVDEEIARLEAVRDALGPHGKIRIDANGGWDVPTAATRLKLLDRAAGGLEYVEQPCATVPELAQLRRITHIPIAADESIRKAEDPYAVVRADAADIMVLKVQPLGGVMACLEIAHELDRPVVVSSALESSVGLAAGIALAAALPELPYACGLATSSLFVHDLVDEPLAAHDGSIDVRRPPLTTQHRELVQASPERTAWWLDRYQRVARLIEAGGTSGNTVSSQR
ncbi:o-succinylbenzoate synthase [Timonella sp. A28]|uniref:o-succinylbenzoate synthase n=1 Tax=Timonella sp. A28 TaxID=3442640 RepID=UPI003EB69E62